jgi:hypothetical protein
LDAAPDRLAAGESERKLEVEKERVESELEPNIATYRIPKDSRTSTHVLS